MMRVPESFEVGSFPLLHREPDHQPEAGGHDPPSKAKS
jgi:hypothetical protein